MVHCTSGLPFKDFAACYGSIRVLGCTAHSLTHQMLTALSSGDSLFDYVIVDEAAQMPYPLTAGALRLAHRWVLVGDPMQLGPLSRAGHPLLARSLMADLLSSGDAQVAVRELRMQYRMNADIQSIANRLVYGGKLQCGNSTVAGRLVRYQPIESEPHWIRASLSAQSVVYVDTGRVTAEAQQQGRSGGSWANPEEARLVLRLVQAFIDTPTLGGAYYSLAVLCPYREQLAILQSLLASPIEAGRVEVSTVDRFQGRDADIVVISMTRCAGSGGGEDGLMDDINRLNVAVTRAKRKLVLVGARCSFVGNAMRVMDEMAEEHHWLVTLCGEQ